MNENFPIIEFLGIRFNVTNCLSGLLAGALVFFLVFALSRKVEMKPGKAQNMLEWVMDFTNGIVKSVMPGSEGRPFYLYAFVMFLFIFMSNQIGLFLQITVHNQPIIKSPTTSPLVTMSLALITLLLSHYYGVKKFGIGGYLADYVKPVGFLLPINLIEEFTNFLTLSLRLYGNIFAGEILLNLIGGMAHSAGLISFVGIMPVAMIWQGFSLFIGSIQAYVFTTLSMVYISHKIEKE